MKTSYLINIFYNFKIKLYFFKIFLDISLKKDNFKFRRCMESKVALDIVLFFNFVILIYFK